ncbi:MAG TPA: Hpt domain-containing protein [Rudaea sp.]|jgi:chemosensory pili system protein ChpA (sensor histidine kinase/response regulator)
MKLQDDIDFTTLNWVKQELDETLRKSHQALEAYVEDPSDAGQMRFCATYLHQVQGTLRMVELYGAAMVVDEMERVAQGLLDGSVKPQDDTYSLLMRGIVQLPDYLERLQSGHKDIPIVLLPLLNDLRATRGEKLLTESALFSPDLSADLPAAAAGAAYPLPALDLRAQGARLRTAFQLSLLRWIRDDSAGDQLDRLIDVLDRVRRLCNNEDARRLWWVASGLLETVRSGSVQASAAIKLLFGKIDRQIKRLVDSGEADFSVEPPTELTKNLLYYLAHSAADGPRAREIARVYQLDTLLPSDREVEHAKGSISGHNRALLDTVSIAIKDDLVRVKEALDIFLRSSNSDVADLAAQVEVLDRVGDTLGMLGLGVPRRVVTEQREIVDQMANKSRSADEATLLDVAGALLYVEASLDDHIDRLGAQEPHSEGPSDAELPKAEVRKILDALMKEASVNIVQSKQDIVAFVESPWDHAKVEPIPRLLEEISGALRMLGLTEPAALMGGIVRFVEVELLRHRRVPTVEQMDKLADALASIEYFMEATREQRGGREQILDVTRRSLESLGYWPVPRDDGGVELEAHGGPAAVEPVPHADAAATRTDFSRGIAAEMSEAARAGGGSEFPDWGDHASGDHASMDRGAAQANATHADDAHLPSIELPGGDSIDDFIARFERSEPAAPGEAAPAAQVVLPEVDLRYAVDIAPGRGVEDLVVGEAPQQQPVAHDLHGLALTETEATTPPATPVESVAAPTVRYVEVEEEIEEEVPDTDAPASLADTSFHTSASDEIDAEIREVFVDEVHEEIENLARTLPLWQADPGDFERLKPIRRSFHTLKGSGRLVGALALGDFSWKIENLLNRVLDKTIPPNMAAQTLTAQAIGVLPELLAGLRGEGAPRSDIGAIMNGADRIAAGEEVWVRTQAPVSMKKVRRIVRRMVPVVDEVPRQAPFAAVESVDIAAPFAPVIGTAESGESIEAQFERELQFAARPADSSPLPHIDPLLYDIFTSEVTSHLAVMDGFVAEAQAAHAPLPASEPLLRAVHTLNGAVAMVDVPVITQVLAPLENYIKRLCAGYQPPSPQGLTALSEVGGLIRSVLSALDGGATHLPNADDLAQRIAELRDSLPEPQLMHTLFSRAVAPQDSSDVAIAEIAPAVSAAVENVDAEPAVQAPVESAVSSRTDWLDALLPAVEETAPVEETAGAAAPRLDEVEAAMPEAGMLEAAVPGTATLEAQVPGAEVPEAGVPEAEMPLAATEDIASVPAEAQAPEPDAMPAPPEVFAIDIPADVDVLALSGDELTAYVSDPLSEPVAAPVEAAASEPLVDEVLGDISPADVLEFVDTPIAAQIPEAFVAQLPALSEPAPMVAASGLSETWTEMPSLADDPQPAGRLELGEMDEDLLEIFVQEGADILDHSDSLMANLRASPHDREIVGGLQRDLHTLKGGARMAGLAPIGDLSHAMESLLDAVSDNRRVMDRITVESLERGFDRLHGLVQRVARRQAIAMPIHAITRFEGLVSGDVPAMNGEPAAPTLEPLLSAGTTDAAEALAPATTGPEEAASAAPPVRLPPRPLPRFEEDDISARAPQEMIRVRSDLLDSLVNYAGEVSIYRSRLEQQISTFRFNLVEFETTVSRLRDQLRKLELETEAQILSRFQREAESTESTFDPLELDRFSQLQQLSRALAESVSDLTSIQGLLDDLTRQSETLLLQQSRVSSDLQEGLMRTRMVPFDSLVPSLRRTLRQAAQELNKRAQLKVEGAQGEMDRNLLERMKAPFEHMMRNALAHGIETPEERLVAGKPLDGTVGIQVSREATEVVLRVSDDGRGLDRDAIRRKAIERGLLKPDVQLSDRDLYGFILETGFSTAETVTQLAGRGVGMDVVHSEIKQLGGSLAIDSTHGTGTTFVIRLPFTLAVTQAILVRLGEGTFAVPMSSVQGVVRIARGDLERRMSEANPSYVYAGEEFLIHELSNLLNVPQGRIADETQMPLLMTRTGDQRAAVRVDAVIGSREIVVKSVGPQISSVPGIFGATIMGDGSVVMILDLAPLVRRHAALRARADSGEAFDMPVVPVLPVVPVADPRRHPLIMVVDDSITMRKVTTRVLERNDMEVVTAKDGLDAVEKLQDKVPDVVLLDVEMPRMDGYELATYMKNDTRLKNVPIIMITSRTGEKHRQRALEIGVERYLGKPYQEADLLRNLQETLRLSRA